MKISCLALALLALTTLSSSALEAPKESASALKVLLDATQNKDLEKFESVCNEVMQQAMTEETMAAVSQRFAEFLKQGYQASYMGSLDRKSVKTFYWKLDFKTDGRPDMLAELSMKDGKVAGFFIR
ncbi:hypothetical protein JIN77_03930 [Verrucomicrobiaceae bacterium R5-34]|nr:hypothetical protein [Verrucomicrobiaceae bacterium R5-34]